MGRRFHYSEKQIRHLLNNMKKETLSTQEHISQLKQELADFHKIPSFLKCKNMGELILKNIETLIGKE